MIVRLCSSLFCIHRGFHAVSQHPHYYEPVAVVAYMLKAHARYYTAIGFAGSLVYDRGDYSGALLGWAELQEDIAAGVEDRSSEGFYWWTRYTRLAQEGIDVRMCQPPTGHLAFMQWTPQDSMMPMPAFTDKKFTHLIYDQILVYNHAALSYLGTNTYLLFAGAMIVLDRP